MNTIKNIAILSLVACIFLTSCEKKEDALTPTQADEKGYFVPQGDNDFDETIVSWKEKYGSLFLYKFEEKDFYWGITKWYQNSETPDPISGDPIDGYEFEAADENYVADQLSLVQDKFLKYYTDEFLKENLPFKVLLTGELWYVKTDASHHDKNTFVGYDHITFNWGSAKIETITNQQILYFKKDANLEFIRYLTVTDRIPVSMKFANVSDYKNKAINGTNFYSYGVLRSSNLTVENDWYDFVEAIISNTIDQLNEEDGILNPTIDTKGLIKKKYDIITEYFKENYNIDLQAIGNDINN